MQILNWIPAHAEQIRYVAPQYDEDSEGDRYCINEDECTSVWYDIIKEVHKTKRPMYYRRRTVDLARRDRYMYQDQINNENLWKEDDEQHWKDYDNRRKMSGDNPIGEDNADT